MRQRWVMGNWKMNGCKKSIQDLLHALESNIPTPLQKQTVVFPPSIYLPLVQTHLSSTSISWGAQTMYFEDAGAFTGEISVPMLKDFDTAYVLVGHSERRHLFGENENFIAKKFHHAKEHDMIPILCVGETLEERTQGKTEAVLTRQLEAIRNQKQDAFSRCILAYEPVWAIGTGKTATPEEAQKAHQFIREWISQFEPEHARQISILYGGSVNEDNAAALFSMPDVDGGLVGGASLNAQQFVEIVKCIN